MTEAIDIRRILRLSPVIPVITIHDPEQAAPLAEALFQGGLKVLEVTLRTPAGLEAITRMRRAVPEALIGVGTLVDPAQCIAADAAGAQFGVSPGLIAPLVEAAQRVRWPLLPGVMTPSEVLVARQAGFTTCKLFPAQQAGGLGMLKALQAVFPDVAFCPTGGISRQSAPEFLKLPNVLCVGGSWLVPDAALSAGNWSLIESLARDAASLR
jgi:2-dehydro-3-deoxyphosphogluconate aldolase/(4S)-4-hydroxy-2-oxoglutarate aldolase